MAIKLANISDWERFDADKLLVLPGGPQSRKIRLEVNCGHLTRWDLMIPGEGRFHLATVEGFETIEFFYAGEARITAMSARVGIDEVDAWFYTADGQVTHSEVPDAVTFTKIAQRRARNPELEYMQFVMNQNIERRLAAQADEFKRYMASLKADPETGEVKDDEEISAAEPAGTESAQSGSGSKAKPAKGGEAKGTPAAGDGKPAGDGAGEGPASDAGQGVPFKT